MNPEQQQRSDLSPGDQLMWILCKPDFSRGVFVPVFSLNDFGCMKDGETPVEPLKPCQLPSPTLKSVSKNTWDVEEDKLLLNLVLHHGISSWTKIANEINRELHAEVAVRLGKHCRERWINHLNPELNSNFHSEEEWSRQEDLKLIKLQLDMGNSWSKIAKEMTGRTENNVKNRWHSLIRKTRTSLKLSHDSQITVVRTLLSVLELECGAASST